jgi:hypothetical protein
MLNTKTIVTIRVESTWANEGDVIIRIKRSAKGVFRILGQKRIGTTKSELGEIEKSLQTQQVLSAEQATQILEQLSRIKIPAAPEFEMGCDGGFTELKVGGYMGKAHYRWWSSPPIGWEQLDELASEIIELSGIYAKIEQKRDSSE